MGYALKMNGELTPLTGLIDPQLLINGGRNTIVFESDESLQKGCLQDFFHQPLA